MGVRGVQLEWLLKGVVLSRFILLSVIRRLLDGSSACIYESRQSGPTGRLAAKVIGNGGELLGMYDAAYYLSCTSNNRTEPWIWSDQCHSVHSSCYGLSGHEAYKSSATSWHSGMFAHLRQFAWANFVLKYVKTMMKVYVYSVKRLLNLVNISSSIAKRMSWAIPLLFEGVNRDLGVERFGTISAVQGSDTFKQSEEHKRKARAESRELCALGALYYACQGCRPCIWPLSDLVHGKTLGKGVDKFVAQNGGNKLPIPMLEQWNTLCGVNAPKASMLLGMYIRRMAPIKNMLTWWDIPEAIQSAIIQAVLVITCLSF
ncbi:hypothetical protein RHMOL_Rhmol11G0038800 [Rhododendron molle]|uniref:Uncharacterized protein n=1 Tax=Rhododendron molle TaxID=49168 RepID=A0ACC0LPG8_RHOML|nr:hypothetical protein RHMOL_Rhmol11G0038800 [Rhododendron molle]